LVDGVCQKSLKNIIIKLANRKYVDEQRTKQEGWMKQSNHTNIKNSKKNGGKKINYFLFIFVLFILAMDRLVSPAKVSNFVTG